MGYGFKADNRVNFRHSKFVIKNSLGLTVYGNRQIVRKDSSSYWVKTIEANKTTDYHIMFDAMAEYNFREYDIKSYSKNLNWTPYIGAGINTIYRITPDYKVDDKIKRLGTNSLIATMKGSFGIKYKITQYLILNSEAYAEWDFSDMLDNDDIRSSDGNIIPAGEKQWYQHDHSLHFSIGITYILAGSKKKIRTKRYPWADNLYK